MDGAVSADAIQALEAWRRAEAAYANAAEEFLSSERPSQILDKETLIELTRLRNAADTQRACYFSACDELQPVPESPQTSNVHANLEMTNV